MLKLYEAYLVFVGVIGLGSLLELTGAGVFILNVAASLAYFAVLSLELIRQKRPTWLVTAMVLCLVLITGFALVDRYMAPFDVYLHWLDLVVLATCVAAVSIRFYFSRHLPV